MRIAIDARYLSHGLVGGIHTYLKNIMPHIAQQAGERGYEVVFYADTKAKFELESLPPCAQVRLLPYSNKLSSFRHDLFMWKEMAQDKPDLVHFTGNYGFTPHSWKTVITVHDEINLTPLLSIYKGHRKEFTVLWMFAWLHFCTRAAVRQATASSPSLAMPSSKSCAMAAAFRQRRSMWCTTAARQRCAASPTRPR
ncbi:MAG: glycosyltransferase family 4 protein [Anaerolineae bacterium]|nr:glycosyltransferase family 4 protein [Anaerolineae bacterium]